MGGDLIGTATFPPGPGPEENSGTQVVSAEDETEQKPQRASRRLHNIGKIHRGMNANILLIHFYLRGAGYHRALVHHTI